MGLRPPKQSRQGHLQGYALDTAQAAPGNLGDTQPLVVLGHERSVDTDLAEFIDQNRPPFSAGPLGEQLADQRRLAGTQRTGDHMSLDIG
ncbi:hypothetical protein Q3H58_003091 [Pseudomonas psychrotolerans]|nr:hypothetical protein [Pseudomonas psychrotolerans]